MGGSIEKAWTEVQLKVAEKTIDKVVHQENFAAMGQEFLEMAGAEMKYQSENDKGFSEGRKHLQEDAGLIISNHPGYVDLPAIIQTLDRDDVKFIVKGDATVRLNKIFGDDIADHLIPTRSSEDKSALAAYRTMQTSVTEHIDDGGVVVLFPTGGTDLDTGEVHFQGGFRRFVHNMDPKQMVYTFYMPYDDIVKLKGKGQLLAGQLSDVYISPKANINRIHKSKPCRIYEKYTQAGEWKDVLSASSGQMLANRNEALTQHYKNLFDL